MIHVPEWLPSVECIGLFNSHRAARNSDMDASCLTIVWFQDDFGLDDGAVDRLRDVDWDSLATDWSYTDW